MGCRNNYYENDACIIDTVRRILNAQREAVEDLSRGCSTSCDQSIEDLLSPQRDRKPTRHTTIPFMLICNDSCKPFVGSGFVNRNRDGSRRNQFECIESPVFKVRGFERGSNSCVKLELLLPVGGRRDDNVHSQEDVERTRYDGHQRGSLCDVYGNRRIVNFRETGLCITVDLNCFCGITCLDPITPEPH